MIGVKNKKTEGIISTLVDNGGGSYTYTDESGVQITFTVNNSTVTGTQPGKTIAIFNDGNGNSVNINETITGLSIVANQLVYTKEDGSQDTIDLSVYLDDTNLARIVNGNLNASTGIATFTRDDSTTFDIDFSSLLDTDSISVITNTVSGNRIATHDDGQGNTVDINETITSFSGTPFSVSYTKEDGSSDNVSLVKPAVNYLNSNSTTNLNTDTTFTYNTLVPIFGFNDQIGGGNAVFTKLNDNELRVEETGFYKIGWNLDLIGVSGQRTSVNARTKVNGTQAGPVASTGYIRFATGHNRSSLHCNFIHFITAGQIITIGARQEANAGTVRMEGTGGSNFYIEKISNN